ncbi:MAG TPA: PAS domain S-box protein, partial [Syntrophorhabdaceae bacterium]|nr:PAS domain S-box protein [Syntrophorhabdaceae bacterium]
EEVYLVRPDGRLVFVNEAVAKSLGFTRDELLKIGVGDIDPIYGPKFIQHFNELKRHNLPPFETIHMAKDGKRIPKEMRSVYLRIGENEYVCGFGHDITERKKTEEELFTAYREWEYIFQAIGHPMLILDGEHTILDANKAVVDAIGMARESLIGRKCYHIFHSVTKDTPPPGCPYEFMLKSRRFETCEMKVEALDRVFIVSCTPVLKNDGTLDKVIHALTDITVLEEAITSLKKSESSYKEFVERSPDAIIIHNGERFVYANHRALKLYGVDDQKDLIGRNILDYIHPDDKEAIKAMVRDILGREIITPISEFRIISPHGKEINIQSTASCISYEGKKAVQVIIRDVTEYKKMEKALIESEARYRNIFENATEGIFQTTPEGRYLDANPAFVRMFGFSSLDELKKEVKDIGRQLYVNPEDRERFKKELADNGYVRDFEVQVKRKDGYPFWISINARVVYDEKGNIMYYEGTNSDITRRKQAEDALRASEEKYRNILERSIEGFFQATPEGRFLSANPALAHIFGYSSPEEMINEVKDLKRLYVQPEQRERLKELYESQGYVYGFEVEVYRKDSKKIWISMTARAIKDEKGKILYYEGTTEDITQRKLAEMALRASEKKFFAAFQSSPNLMAISTVKDGRYIDVNEAFCKALGYSRSEVIGKTSIHLHIFEKKEDRDRFIEKLSRGDKVRNEIANIRTRFGDIRTISFNADIIEI